MTYILSCTLSYNIRMCILNYIHICWWTLNGSHLYYNEFCFDISLWLYLYISYEIAFKYMLLWRNLFKVLYVYNLQNMWGLWFAKHLNLCHDLHISTKKDLCSYEFWKKMLTEKWFISLTKSFDLYIDSTANSRCPIHHISSLVKLRFRENQFVLIILYTQALTPLPNGKQ